MTEPIALPLDDAPEQPKPPEDVLVYVISLHAGSPFSTMPGVLLHNKFVTVEHENQSYLFKVIACQDFGVPPTRELSVIKA